ncbi:MAG: hypothetical protein H8F28_15850, partial [Fibrella sp.]|nr:hypothetical protein [Armatimonadota bacterium]
LGQATVGNSSANAVAGNFVVGQFADGTDERAYLFDFGTATFTDLGTLGGQNSVARAVTASGIVVGQADDGIEQRAFIYDRAGAGGMEDLTTILNAQSSGWTVLTDVYGVTDQGYLVGSGIRNGETHVFAVLQPVPAPPAAVSLIIGAGTAMLGYGIRQLRRAKTMKNKRHDDRRYTIGR